MNRIIAVLSVILLVWLIVADFLAFPAYISYFNEASGGPNNGHKLLLGSNVDWGQECYCISDWLQSNPSCRPFLFAMNATYDAKVFQMQDAIAVASDGAIRDPLSMQLSPEDGSQIIWIAVSRSYTSRNSLFSKSLDEENVFWRIDLAYFADKTPVYTCGNAVDVYRSSLKQLWDDKILVMSTKSRK